MTNVKSNPNDERPEKVYDLEERTEKFAKQIVDFSNLVPKSLITIPLVSQLVRAGTSIGANYHEADGANSKRDFANKIAIALKEAKETKYWLKIIAHSTPILREKADILWQEAQELNLIFSAVLRKTR